MILKKLTDHIEAKVPLLLNETEHDWVAVALIGCEVCGQHDGFECRNCRRCVDWEMDSALHRNIGEMLFWKDEQ